MSIQGFVPKPEGATWTDDQWSAITARGANLLVAAAAGSGKTAVLVERLIRMVGDEKHPIDVDRLLVATFTKAASEEMRHRIREALEKQLLTAGESEHIARQLALLPRASITTLHSFCMEVVRQNFVEVGLDPQFRIGNEIEITLLQNDVLETVLEEFYSSGDEAFYALVDSFTSDRSDAKVFELVLKLYGFAQAHPFPQQWLTESIAPFHAAADATRPASERLVRWSSILLDSFSLEAQAWQADLQQAVDICAADPGLAAFGDLLAKEAGEMGEFATLASESNWTALSERLAQHTFIRMPSIKKDECDEALKAQAQNLRDGVKERKNKVTERWFGRSLDQHVDDIAGSISVIDALVRLTLRRSIQSSQNGAQCRRLQ
jgi:ATP-dependent helicase/nuclease subunit A